MAGRWLLPLGRQEPACIACLIPSWIWRPRDDRWRRLRHLEALHSSTCTQYQPTGRAPSKCPARARRRAGRIARGTPLSTADWGYSARFGALTATWEPANGGSTASPGFYLQDLGAYTSCRKLGDPSQNSKSDGA